MDPVTIFGLTCNVLQVISFTEQAIKLGRTLYESGSVDPELARNTDALNTCMQDLNTCLQNSVDPTTQDTKDLVSVAEQILDCGARTKKELHRISGPASTGSLFGAFRGWIALVRGGKRKLDKLEGIMRARQRVLETKLLVRICKVSEAEAIRNQASFDSLNSTLQSFVLARTQGQTTLEQIMKIQSESIKTHVAVEANRTRESTKKSIVEQSHRIENNISSTLRTIKVAETSKEDRARLLESLRYPGMKSRQNQIKDPYYETFEWIFKSPSHYEDKAPDVRWDDFTSWLRADSLMPYWIAGKAGSGKSTLMKFLAGHKQTSDILSTTGDKIKILSHYMWAASDPLQRSVTGFLCSLLHQLLEDCDELGSLVLNTFEIAKRKRQFSDWSNKDLESVLEFALSVPQEKFCLFLDGVDEADDQITLIELVTRICNLERVRVCLSSRPEPVLRKHFQSYASLYMQDLTAGDIEKWVRGRLGNLSLPFDGELDSLVRDICWKADGVFLWVILAVKSLEFGTCYGEKTGALWARLDALPRDVEELYLAMWTREVEKNPSHQQNAARCLNTILEFENWMVYELQTIMLLTMTLNPSLATALIHNPSESMSRKLDGSCQETLKTVDLRTAGLLEVNKNYKDVRFIHRSAVTFLHESVRAQEILNADKRTPHERRMDMIRGYLAYAITCHTLFGGSKKGGSKRDTTDSYSVGSLSVNSLTAANGNTLPPLSFQFRPPVYDLRCHIVLGDLRRIVDNETTESELRGILSLAQIGHSSGRWSCSSEIWTDQNFNPDFLGIVISTGFFDYGLVSMEELYAASPPGMKVSAFYEDYILKNAVIGTRSFDDSTLPVLRLIQVIADNRKSVTMSNSISDVKPWREQRRFQISNDVLSKFNNHAHQLPPCWTVRDMRRALLGLLLAGTSQARNVMIHRIDEPVGQKDHYEITMYSLLGVGFVFPQRSEAGADIIIHTNAKTILLLLLAGVSDRPADGPSIFSDLIAAVENVNMPVLFRIIGVSACFPRRRVGHNESSGNGQNAGIVPRYPRRFLVPADRSGSGRDAKGFDYSNLQAIWHATKAAFLEDSIDVISAIVVPGLEDYIQEILPEMRETTTEAFKELIFQQGLCLDSGQWPPQPYSPIDPEIGAEA